jgi:hypothetical protein
MGRRLADVQLWLQTEVSRAHHDLGATLSDAAGRSPDGATTGAGPKPPAWFFRLINPFVSRILASRWHGFLSSKYMLLVYTDRRSGRELSFPIGYFEWDGGALITFSSGRW